MTVGELSMTSIARALEVTPAALYHYFPNREAVFEALAAEILDRVALPSTDLGWDEWLRSYGDEMRLTVRSSPWARHLVGRTRPLVSGLRHVEAALEVLHRDGFEPTEAFWAIQLVQRFSVMAAIHEATMPHDPSTERAFSAQVDCIVTGIGARLRGEPS